MVKQSLTTHRYIERAGQVRAYSLGIPRAKRTLLLINCRGPRIVPFRVA